MNLEPQYVYRAKCEEITDGDTFKALVDLGFNVFTKIKVRLHGVDAFETSESEGAKATEFLNTLIGKSPLILKSYKDQQSFARWVCDVWLLDGTNVSQAIKDAGYAKP